MGSNFLIYMHTAPNGKSYIGQTNDLRMRNAAHQSKTGCRAFHAAIKKHGWENFTHSILAEGLSPDDANKLEAEFIARYNTLSPSGYNLKEGGNNFSLCAESKAKIAAANTGKKASAETRAKMSASQAARKPPTKETRAKLAAASRNRKPLSQAERDRLVFMANNMTPETRRKISESKKGKKLNISDEVRRRLSDAHRNLSEETRVKLSVAAKNRQPPSDETRAKLTAANMARWAKLKESGDTKQSAEHVAKRLASIKRNALMKEAALGGLFA